MEHILYEQVQLYWIERQSCRRSTQRNYLHNCQLPISSLLKKPEDQLLNHTDHHTHFTKWGCVIISGGCYGIQGHY